MFVRYWLNVERTSLRNEIERNRLVTHIIATCFLVSGRGTPVTHPFTRIFAYPSTTWRKKITKQILVGTMGRGGAYSGNRKFFIDNKVVIQQNDSVDQSHLRIAMCGSRIDILSGRAAVNWHGRWKRTPARGGWSLKDITISVRLRGNICQQRNER